MAMRLLPKSEIDKIKGQERKREIDEGLKIARRIDSLRETVVEEEKNLESFRAKTVGIIHEEISRKIKERNELEQENKTLRAQRKKLQEPLDSAWLELADAKERLDRYREGLDERENYVRDSERALRSTKETVSQTFKEALIKKQLADEHLKEAVEITQKAQIALKTVRSLEREVKTNVEERHKQIEEREQCVDKRERDASIKEKELAESAEELKKGWILLNDRQTMFERTLKRKK